jgi:hypothetical protein
MGRALIAGIVGGIVVFVWGFISHVVLHIGGAGLQALPNEATVVEALRLSVKEPGMYLFPGADMSRRLTPEEEQAWEAKYKAGPSGLLIYRPPSANPDEAEGMMTPKQLVIEAVSGILAGILVASVLFGVAGSYLARVLATTCFGLFGWLAISISYWNWYRFDPKFTLSEGIEQTVGWFLAGLVMAAIVKRRATA